LAARGVHVVIGTLPNHEKIVGIDPRVRVVSVAGPVHNPSNWLRAARGIKNLTNDVDVLFVSGIWGPVDGLAMRLAGDLSVPVHTRICGMLEDYILTRNPARKWLGRVCYMEQNLNNSASLIVNTSIEAKHVQALGFRTPIDIIPNGVVLPRSGAFIPRKEAAQILGISITEQDKVLLYLGRIHPKKGLHKLLGGIKDVLSKNPQWRLVVAGDFYSGQRYQDTVLSLARESGMGDRIHFLGEVQAEKKAAAFSLADLFVLPSESEGFSNAVLEAMSYVIPVLITPGCNFPEVEEHAAGWITPADEAALRDQLNMILPNAGELSARGAAARKLIEDRYLENHVVDAYWQLASKASKMLR
jgi:glycosyltransferase involved in cell wall biosynthesis